MLIDAEGWTPWKPGDAMPPAGRYWVTAPDIGCMGVFQELLANTDERSWRYFGVIAYSPRRDADCVLKPYTPPPSESSGNGT